jgi:RecJ-like exonuclease
MSLQNIKALNERAEKLAERILREKNIAVIHHYDADGLASGAIMVKALQRAGKNVKFLGIKQLYTDTIEEIRALGDFFVFVDFGSSHIKELSEAFSDNFIVIDHHQPKYGDAKNFLNCWHFGIDGSNEASGSTLAYIVAKHIANSTDLSSLAIVGSVGDIQDSSGKLIGLNRTVLKEAIANKHVLVKKDLRLYGRFTRPIVQFLAYSTDPIIPFLTGSEENSMRFLLDRGFELKRDERWLSYEDLTYEEKQKLATELIVYMSSLSVPEWKIARLIGETYTLLKEPRGPLRDAKEYATLLNACGRNDACEIGFAVCLGDRDEAYAKALSLLTEHRKKLREGIQLMVEEGVEERKNFYYFNAGSRIQDSLIGVIAGMLYSSNAISQEKPIVALAKQDDGFIKVSARATQELVTKGLNLAKALRECCAKIGNNAEGGGHNIAAGARIQEESIEKFLEILDKKIEEQLREVGC